MKADAPTTATGSGVRGVSSAFEKHYRAQELAALWGYSPATIRDLFRNDPDVPRLPPTPGKRPYVSLSIPESVALRVHQRLCHQPLKALTTRRNPLRVIHLRDLNGGVAQKPRQVVKRDA